MKKNQIVLTKTMQTLRAMLVFTLLALSGGLVNAAVSVPLNDPKIYYDGVLFHSVTATSVTFNRHTPAAYADASSGIVYAPCNRTRATQSGVRVRIKTSSPNVYFTFAPQMTPDGYFFGGNSDGSYNPGALALGGRDGFAIFVNGTLKQTIASALSFTAVNPTPGTVVEFEVTLPLLWSVVLTGIQLDNGYSLVDAGANTKPKYAAFGTSITMGTGQYVNTAKTYAFKLAKAKGWNLHNFAVAGSIVGWQLAYDVQTTPFDIISIEQGFNDWASPFARDLSEVQAVYKQFIDEIRKYQPAAKIYCIAPIYSSYVPATPKYTLDQFRTMVQGLVDTRKNTGDNNIFYINGASIISSSFGLDDGIHLNESGADMMANGLIPLMVGGTTTPPPPVAGFIPANDAKFLYTGRIDFTNPKRPQFAFPGVSIKANFQGPSVSVVIKDYAGGGEQNTNYFNVIIDGGTPIKLQVNSTDTLYPISTTLTDGNHSIEIFKRTETSVGKSEFRGLVLASGKTLLTPPARPAKRFEFIGDSYTCGYGNEVATTSPNTGFHSTNENNYMAWGAIASRALNAEYMCTAYSGRGMFRNNTGQTTFTVPTFYDHIIADQPSPSWNKNNYVPDVAVVMLGINDMFPFSVGGTKLDSASFVNTYINFVTKLRGYYPGACIICAVPNGLSDWYPEGAQNWTHMKNYMTAIVNNFKSKGDSKVYNWVMIQQGSQNEPYGEDWHPSIQTHQIMANDLVNFINTTVGCGSGVTKVDPTITFTNATKTYGDAAFTITATSNSSGAITYASGNNAIATVTSAGSVTIKDAGSVTITASQAATSTHNAGSASITLTINKANLTATADNKSKVQGTANPALTITYTGFVYGEDKSVLAEEPIASCLTTTASPAGTYPITLIDGLAANYNITLINGTLTVTDINAENPTITFDALTKIYGDPSFTVAATSNSPGAFIYSITSGNQFASITSSGTVTITGAGTVTIQAYQSSASGFNPGSVTATLTIEKASLTATADDKTRSHGTANPVFTITYSGFVYGENSSVLASAPVASCSAIATSDAGTYPITLSGGSAANYNITRTDGTLTITQTGATLNYTSALTGKVGTTITLSATSNSNGAITYSVTNGTGAASLSGPILNLTQAGTATLTISQDATLNHAAASITVIITITEDVVVGECTVAAWNSSTTYLSGVSVSYQGNVYVAKWYSVNSIPGALIADIPGSQEWGPWQLLGPCGNMNGCSAYPWSASIAYFQGSQVSLNGNIYTAKWYCQGTTPSSDPYGPWQYHGTCEGNTAACNAMAWTATTTYFAGNEVSYNGNLYRAKWWALGNIPGAEQWGPWELAGPCAATTAPSSNQNNNETMNELLEAYPTLATEADKITVKVTIAGSTSVQLSLYTLNNEEVIRIADTVLDASTEYSVRIAELNSGIYILKLTTSEGVTTKKICK